MFTRPWVREINKDCFIVTDNGETMFIKTDNFFEASKFVDYINGFIDTMEELDRTLKKAQYRIDWNQLVRRDKVSCHIQHHRVNSTI